MKKIFDNISWPPLSGGLIIAVILFKLIGPYLEDQKITANQKSMEASSIHMNECIELSDGDKESLFECLCREKETIQLLEAKMKRDYDPYLTPSDVGYKLTVFINYIIDSGNYYCFDTVYINNFKEIRKEYNTMQSLKILKQ